MNTFLNDKSGPRLNDGKPYLLAINHDLVIRYDDHGYPHIEKP
jgi:hypothetical protein